MVFPQQYLLLHWTLSRYQLKWNTHQDTPCCWSAPVCINSTHLLIVGGGLEIGKENTYTSNVFKFNKSATAGKSIQVIEQIP